MIFELLVILFVALVVYFCQRKDKRTLMRFVYAFLGVLLFEYFTQSLWVNKGLESWAYIYLDISWIITILWSVIIILAIAIVENYMKKASDIKKMLCSVGLITVFGVIEESLVIGFGFREYAPVVQQMLKNSPMIFGSIPLREPIYIFAFMFLVVAFVKYWESKGGKK